MQIEELVEYITYLKSNMKKEWSFMEMCMLNDAWVRAHVANPLVHEMDAFIARMVEIGVLIDATDQFYTIKYRPNILIMDKILDAAANNKLTESMLLGHDPR